MHLADIIIKTIATVVMMVIIVVVMVIVVVVVAFVGVVLAIWRCSCGRQSQLDSLIMLHSTQQTRQDSRRSGVILGENKKRTNKTEKDRYRVHFPKTFNVKQYDK